MKKIAFLALISLSLVSISPLANASRWWNIDKTESDGSGVDLDSYQHFIDDEGQEVTSLHFAFAIWETK